MNAENTLKESLLTKDLMFKSIEIGFRFFVQENLHAKSQSIGETEHTKKLLD